jgi:predicted methyltransferase
MSHDRISGAERRATAPLVPEPKLLLDLQGIRAIACLVACLAGDLAVQVASGQQPPGASHINSGFMTPDIDQWVARFERPGREIYDRRHEIVAATGVNAGMVVADIGAGTGLFTRLFAALIGSSGRVYAVDISAAFVDNINRSSRAHGQTNVQGIVNSPTEVPLPPESVDIAFICDTYHHFEHPEAMMRSIRAALKPGGSVVVIDFRKIPGYSTPWVMSHVRADQSTVVREIEAAGFRLVETRDFLRRNYFPRFAPAEVGHPR